MRSFAKQVEIVICQKRREGVGIVHCCLVSTLVENSQLILGDVARIFGSGANGFVQTSRMDAPHGLRAAMRRIDHPGLLGLGQKGANGQGAAAGVVHLVGTKDIERVFVAALHEGLDFL